MESSRQTAVDPWTYGDVDTIDVEAATERGARVVTEPTELAFGDVVARFRDPQGHLWWVHQHVEDVDPTELGRRFQQEAAVKAMLYVGDTLEQEMSRGVAGA